MSSKKQPSRFEKLDRLIPLLGLGLIAYFLSRSAADRRAARRHLADLRNAALLGAAAAPVAPVETPGVIRASVDRLDRTKKFLILAMLIAVIAYVMGGSTFATFSAQTQNGGTTIGSGTLTMSDTVNSGTVCNSYGNGVNGNAVTSADNYNANCASVLSLQNEAPGTTDTSGSYIGGYATVKIINTGSINASLFSLFAPYVNGSLSTQVSSGALVGTGQTVTGFTVSSLEGPVSTNDKIILNYGATQQEFCAGGNTAASTGTATITISGGYSVGAGTNNACPGTSGAIAAATTFSVGTRLNDTSTDTTTTNTDCWDAKTTTPPTGFSGATKGTDLNFNPVAGNPFCSTALLWIQEQSTVGSNSDNYCWFGRGSSFGDQGGNTEDTFGQCRTPTQMSLASSITTNAATTTTLNGALTNTVTSTTLNGAINNSTTSITVANGTGFNNGDTVVVDREAMTIVSGGGTTSWVVTRGANSTTAVAHNTGSTVMKTQSVAVNNGASFSNGDIVVVDSEEMLIVTGGTTNSWTVARGSYGTGVATHSNSATVTKTQAFSLNIGSTLYGNITGKDQITITESGNTLTCYTQASGTTPAASPAPYYIGANSGVGVLGCYGAPSTTFDSNAIVKDTSAFTALNGSNPSSTISNFDTAHLGTGAIFLPPLTGNGTDNPASTVQLAANGAANHTDTRTFYVGVYFPAPSGTNQNYLQGLLSTFGLTFHIDQ